MHQIGRPREVQVIEMTAKKYEYSPSPLRVRRGAKVQLRIMALDRTHEFKINLRPDGSDKKSDLGLIFGSNNDDCLKLEKGVFRPWWNLWRAHREPTTAAIVADSGTAE
jgi:hypothetical protein